MIYFVLVASVLSVENNEAVLQLNGHTSKIEFGGALTLIHNATEDELSCSGKIKAIDLLIEGTSTTVAQMMAEHATMKDDIAALKQAVGMMPPPMAPPAPPPTSVECWAHCGAAGSCTWCTQNLFPGGGACCMRDAATIIGTHEGGAACNSSVGVPYYFDPAWSLGERYPTRPPAQRDLDEYGRRSTLTAHLCVPSMA